MEKIHASKLLAGLVPAGFLTSDPEVELVTTDRSWVIMIRVRFIPCSSFMISRRICPCVTTSSAVVASSIISRSGLNIRLSTMDNRCIIPPDSSCG